MIKLKPEINGVGSDAVEERGGGRGMGVKEGVQRKIIFNTCLRCYRYGENYDL